MRTALAGLVPALLFSVLGHAPAAVPDAPPGPSETLWQAVLFDGVKVGHTQASREVVNGEVRTREVMDLEIQRVGEPVRLHSDTRYVETADGRPLSFLTQVSASAQTLRLAGEIAAGQVEVKQLNAGASSTRTLPFPPEVLLGEAQRLELVGSGLEPGDEIEFLMFETTRLEAIRVVTRVIGPQRVEVYDRDLELIEVEQTIHFPEQKLEARAFVDRQFRPYRTSLQMLGMRMELVACDQRCATRPNQRMDHLGQLLLQSPRVLGRRDLQEGVRYQLSSRDGALLSLPQTSEQRQLGPPGKHIELEVCARCGQVEVSAADRAAALLPTLWLQSDAAEVQALKDRALRGVHVADPRTRMQALTGFVSGHIRNKTLSVGYASALETARSGNGDCTEHALLLAALGRAAGIPTRVATGFAYVPEFDNKRDVFVPHAWTQALLDGRWVSFDAALGGFDAGHIVVATGDGDPSRFHAGMNVLGNLDMARIQRLAPEARR